MSSSQPIFVIAPEGMLGRACVALLDKQQRPYRTGSRPQLDITDPASLEQAIPDTCRVVLNCSAFTDVDGAETQETAARQVNGQGVANLAQLCKARDATLIHFSTDYVFNGNATMPYPTTAPHEPLNAYGRSKAEGEQAIWDSQCRHLLIRTSWLYAPWGNNFVRTMARLSEQRPSLKVVHDQRGRPTSSDYLATRSLALLDQGAAGTFHVTDGGECTWFEFTQEIVRQLGHNCEVTPCSSDEFVRPAKRPQYSVLDLSKTDALLGASRPWQDNLKDTLQRLEPL